MRGLCLWSLLNSAISSVSASHLFLWVPLAGPSPGARRDERRRRKSRINHACYEIWRRGMLLLSPNSLISLDWLTSGTDRDEASTKPSAVFGRLLRFMRCAERFFSSRAAAFSHAARIDGGMHCETMFDKIE